MNKKFLKRYIKTIVSAKAYPKQVKDLIRTAPIPVLKVISNAAIVASRGNIKLNPKQKKAFSKQRKFFQIFGNKSIGFDKKRQYLNQKGGALGALIPILLSTVVPLVGDLLFRAIGKKE